MPDPVQIAHQLSAGSDRLAFFAALIVMGIAFVWYVRGQEAHKKEQFREICRLHEERRTESMATREALYGNTHALNGVKEELRELRIART